MKTALVGLLVAAFSVAQTLPTIHVNSEPGGYTELGQAVTTIQDMDGDGVREIVATRQNDLSVYTPGCPPVGCYSILQTRGLRVFSGRTGALLMSHDDAQVNVGTQVQCYPAVAEGPDLDGDGKNDIVWAVKLDVRVISSQTGATLRSHNFAGPVIQQPPLSLASLEDADGDGIRDYVVGQASADRVMLFSGATGALVWTKLAPDPGSSFGSSAVSLGDVNGDGRSDVAVCAPSYYNSATSEAGKTVVLSGIDGSVVWSATATSFQGDKSLSNAGDVDGDGIADIVNLFYDTAFGGLFGGLRWRSGATGAVLNSIGGLNIAHGPVTGGFDVNGDGSPDAAVAEKNAVTGGTHPHAWVYSATGALLAALPASMPEDYTSLMLTPDLNGDGYGDLVTAERWNASNGITEVRARTILGAQPYGTSLPGGPSLSWVPIGAQPSFGVVAVTGATPSGAGLLGASTAAFAGSPPIWIDPQHLIILQPIQFDPAGTFFVPLDLRQPSIAGVSAYVQAADGSFPAAATTNALQLLFGK